MSAPSSLSPIERYAQRQERRWAARRVLIVDMLKSYAAPLILSAFIVPALNVTGGPPARLGAVNYALLILGLAVMGLAIIFVPEKE